MIRDAAPAFLTTLERELLEHIRNGTLPPPATRTRREERALGVLMGLGYIRPADTNGRKKAA